MIVLASICIFVLIVSFLFIIENIYKDIKRNRTIKKLEREFDDAVKKHSKATGELMLEMKNATFNFT